MSDQATAAAAPIDPPAASQADFFDGASSRRRPVTLSLSDRLEIRSDGATLAHWPYADIRRADGPADRLRLSCLAAPALARLEVRDRAVADELRARCTQLDRDGAGDRGLVAIVGWSLAAVASLIVVALFGAPLIADRVTPLLPQAFERRLGDVADQQVKALFGDKVCSRPAGQAAFNVLVDKLRTAGGFDRSVAPAVLSSTIPNAMALPGGRVYLFSALLDKADNPDEVAGVLAHELGHVAHRDSLRQLIRDGGTSFLVGMLFGDVTGSGALIFASRTLITSSYSRDTERAADTFSIATMHGLGRPAKPMGELLFRVTGAQAKSGIDILASHPLTEDRLARMNKEDAPARGEPLLSAEQWQALKAICD